MNNKPYNKFYVAIAIFFILSAAPWLLVFLIPIVTFAVIFYTSQENLKKTGNGPGAIPVFNKFLKSLQLDFEIDEKQINSYLKNTPFGNTIDSSSSTRYKSHTSNKNNNTSSQSTNYKTESVSIYNSRKVDPYTLVVPDSKFKYTNSHLTNNSKTNLNKSSQNTSKKSGYTISQKYKTDDNTSIWDNYESVMDLMKQ